MTERLRPRARAALIGSLWLALVTNANAADPPANPTKQQCIAANETAQSLRQAGQLRATREQLLLCVAKTCPGLVREDCAQRLNEVENATPTVVFIAKGSDGSDLVAVQVKMDGALLVDHLDGSAISVEPGEHAFELSAAGYPNVTKKLVMHEGAKGRSETVTFASPSPATRAPVAFIAPTSSTTASPDATPDAVSSTKGNGQRLVAYVLGGAGIVGVGVGAVFGLVANSTYHGATDHCPTSSTCDSDGISGGHDAHTQATISTVAFVAGGALLAGGVVLYLTAPKHGSLSVQTAAGQGSYGLRLGGSF